MTQDEVRYYRRHAAWGAVLAAFFAGISWYFGASFPLWWALGCVTVSLSFLAVAQWWKGSARSVTRVVTMIAGVFYVVLMVWKMLK
ncbi:MAG TPA: hypothetical protein VMT52_15190 [Planctomycetota bacterium]|nr:hypothetical protein [Planctomycetota bacterium]